MTRQIQMLSDACRFATCSNSLTYFSGRPFSGLAAWGASSGCVQCLGVRPLCERSFSPFGTVHYQIKDKRLTSVCAQPCLTPCDPMDCSPRGSSVHGILQARTLEWVAITFSRGSSWPRGRTWVSILQADSLPSESPGKPPRARGPIKYEFQINKESFC